MASPRFEAALPFILRWEGGYVNHPNDPGGATNKGVTQAVYDNWRARQGQGKQDVRLITDGEMHAIYEAGYWVPAKCPQLPEPLDQVQLDTAVNMGVGRAVRFLQTAVGAEPDGAFGPGTAQCVADCDPGTALVAYCDTREAYYKQLTVKNPKLAVFLKGWMNRLNSLRKHVGLPGYEAAGDEVDFGEAGFMGRVPDIGLDPKYD
jgi:lysozyme family protein